ncbi:MAG: hypothetical protein Q9204_000099 [Flavoplaca sp. TL-2023a]
MTDCKKEKIKIGKKELRFGVWVDYGEHQGWAWRHWGCVTPRQLEGLHDVLEGDVDMLDGYEEVPDDCQEKVKRALKNGHVDDEDWRGDVEQNRPGMKGFRSPAARKKKAEEQEQFDGQEGDQSPSKPAPKKRGRAKKDASEDGDVEEPVQKKTKVTAKRGKKVKDEEESDVVDEGEANHKVSQPKTRQGKQTKGKDVESDVAAKPKSKASAKKTKGEPTPDEPDITSNVPPKKAAASKKGKKGNEVIDDSKEPIGEQAQPAKAGTRSRKAKVEDAEEAEEAVWAGEHDEPAVKGTKKSRSTKNAANTKKPIAKKAQKNVDGPDAETTGAETPKAKRGRKKANI